MALDWGGEAYSRNLLSYHRLKTLLAPHAFEKTSFNLIDRVRQGASGKGRCKPRIIFYCDGCTSESKVDFVFPQDGCGSALPELVPLFDGVKGGVKSIPACKVILRAGRDWKGTMFYRTLNITTSAENASRAMPTSAYRVVCLYVSTHWQIGRMLPCGWQRQTCNH
eukprot:1142943-Pelagomonas_calceolata.AAC.2